MFFNRKIMMTTKPKVLRIFNRLILGGPVLNALILTKFLADEFDTEMLSGIKDEGEVDAASLIKKYDAHPIYLPAMRRSINPLQDFIAFWQLIKYIRKAKPQIVHTHASKPGLLGRLAAYYCKVPVIVHTFHGHACHNYFGKIKTYLYIAIERFLAKKSTKIIAISEQQKYELGTLYKICDPSKIAIVPLGFDLDAFYQHQSQKRIAFRQKYQIANDEIAIGIIGRLVPIKNHQLFIDALQKVIAQTNKKIKIIIVGDGDELQNIQNSITKHQLSFNYYPAEPKAQQFTFTSWIFEMDAVYAGLDIVCLTSLNEGTPVSLIEAQAAGKAIVTTNVGGVMDVVLENKTALITPSEDVDAFANALLQLVDNDSLRNAFGTNGLENVKVRYDKARLLSDTSNLYKQLLGSLPTNN
jgi:glycosyltransferase involved in cell wall biosynthesis